MPPSLSSKSSKRLVCDHFGYPPVNQPHPRTWKPFLGGPATPSAQNPLKHVEDDVMLAKRNDSPAVIVVFIYPVNMFFFYVRVVIHSQYGDWDPWATSLQWLLECIYIYILVPFQFAQFGLEWSPTNAQMCVPNSWNGTRNSLLFKDILSLVILTPVKQDAVILDSVMSCLASGGSNATL